LLRAKRYLENSELAAMDTDEQIGYEIVMKAIE